MLYLLFNWIFGLIESIPSVLFILLTGGESDRDVDCLLEVKILNLSSLCFRFVAVTYEVDFSAVAR